MGRPTPRATRRRLHAELDTRRRILFTSERAGTSVVETAAVDGSGAGDRPKPRIRGLARVGGGREAHRVRLQPVRRSPGLRRVRLGQRRPQADRGEGLFDDDPAWSPDGRKIVFVRHDVYGTEFLYTINADGSGLRFLFEASSMLPGLLAGRSPDRPLGERRDRGRRRQREGLAPRVGCGNEHEPVVVTRRSEHRLRLGSGRRLGDLRRARARRPGDAAHGQRRRRRVARLVSGRAADRLLTRRPPRAGGVSLPHAAEREPAAARSACVPAAMPSWQPLP